MNASTSSWPIRAWEDHFYDQPLPEIPLFLQPAPKIQNEIISLFTKFGYLRFWNSARKKKAFQVVEHSRHLVMRPMMLSYIDYLVEEFVEKGITNFQDGFNFSGFDMARRFFGDKINLILPRCVVFVCLRREFAARGGNQSKGYEYSGSNSFKQVGWFSNNSRGKTYPVGVLKSNELGLYGMSGNVWEWCYDWYIDGYYDECKTKSHVGNPIGPVSGMFRVVCGGSWWNDAHILSTDYRAKNAPLDRDSYRGFRLVFVP